MNPVYISVILPIISDSAKLPRFCSSLFSSKLNTELILCGELTAEVAESIPSEFSDKIKLVRGENPLAAAFSCAQGAFIMISDVNVIFADGAFETMIYKARGASCACAVSSTVGGGASVFTRTLSFDELSQKPSCFCHLLRAETIKNNSLAPIGSDSLSLMLFLADFYRYEACVLIDDALVCFDGELEYRDSSTAKPYLKDYSELFAATQNPQITMFFIRAVVCALDTSDEDDFHTLREALSAFCGDYTLCAWAKASFGIDISLLCDENTDFSDFKLNGVGVWYKEITMPLLANDIVMDFYSGKQGLATLKRCVGAWLYYKLYRRRDDVIKRVGCKLCMRLLGGDFNA